MGPGADYTPLTRPLSANVKGHDAQISTISDAVAFIGCLPRESAYRMHWALSRNLLENASARPQSDKDAIELATRSLELALAVDQILVGDGDELTNP